MPRRGGERSNSGLLTFEDDELMRIGAVAERIGISERTLRYYEEFGLVSPTAYSKGGTRLYNGKTIARVESIRMLQSLMGFNLEEIREILAAEDHLDDIKVQYRISSRPKDELLADAIATLENLYRKVDDKQARLQGFKDDLQARLDRVSRLLDTRGSG